MLKRDGFWYGLSGAAGVVVLAVGVYLGWQLLQAITAIATPFVVAIVIALLLDPLVDLFQTKIRIFKKQRLPAVLLVYFLFLLFFVAIIFILAPQIGDQAKNLIDNAPQYVNTLKKLANTFIQEHPKIGPIELPHKDVDKLLGENSDKINQYVTQYGNTVVKAVLSSLSNALNVVVVPIIMFYILVQMEYLKGRMHFLMPVKMREHFVKTTSDVGGVFGNYFRGMFTVAALYGLVTMLVFFAFGLKSYALLLGVVAGCLYPVPYLGPILTGLVSAVVSLATGHTFPQTVALLATVIVLVNGVFDNVLVPRLVGQGVGLHPLLTMFALFLGNNLFGLWGMLLSVPVAASIQVVLFRLIPKLAQATPAHFLGHPEAVTAPPKLRPMSFKAFKKKQ
jgi:predicted PurR-regulated permease PerM